MENMLIFTSSKYVEPTNFSTILNNFITAANNDNINVTYVKSVSSDTSWQNIRVELADIVQANNIKYVMLLGDTNIIPYSIKQVNTLSVTSDIMYTDLDYDGLTDLNFALGRVPTEAVTDYLIMITEIHNKKGIVFNQSEEFNTGTYCNTDWITKITGTTNLRFAGHGSPWSITGDPNAGGCTNLSSYDMPGKYVFAQHPLIRAHYPCSVAQFNDAGTFASRWLKYGVVGAFARTTSDGVPSTCETAFYPNLAKGMSFAEAYYNSLHDAQTNPLYSNNASTWHIVYFGDPSIHARSAIESSSNSTSLSPSISMSPSASVSPSLSPSRSKSSSTSPSASPSTQPPSIVLSATSKRISNKLTVTLKWVGARTSLKLYRNNVYIKTIPNTGTYTETIVSKANKYVTYKVCDDYVCSNIVNVK
jgi:hypothetical protein